MIYFEIKQKNGEIIASNMKKCPFFSLLKDDPNISIKDKKIKSQIKEYDSILVWLVVEDEDDLLNSNKLFKKTMNIYANSSKDFFEYYFSKEPQKKHLLILANNYTSYCHSNIHEPTL